MKNPSHRFGLGCSLEDAVANLNVLLKPHRLRLRSQKNPVKYPEQINIAVEYIKPKPKSKAWLKGFDHGNNARRRWDKIPRLPAQHSPYATGTKEQGEYQDGYSAGQDAYYS